MTLKLSEAIREGAQKRPQARGAFFRKGGSCVLGAAAEAVKPTASQLSKDEVELLLERHWPALKIMVRPPHHPTGEKRMLWKALEDGNDVFLMRREELADWLEGLGL